MAGFQLWEAGIAAGGPLLLSRRSMFDSVDDAKAAAERMLDALERYPHRRPYAYWIVDVDTGERVAYGERGQIVVNHVSKAFFLPNNAERDLATRALSADEAQLGDSVADIAPLAQFRGATVIEGVY